MKYFLKINNEIIINIEMIKAIKGVFQEKGDYKIKILTTDNDISEIIKHTKKEAEKAYRELLEYMDVKVVELS